MDDDTTKQMDGKRSAAASAPNFSAPVEVDANHSSRNQLSTIFSWWSWNRTTTTKCREKNTEESLPHSNTTNYDTAALTTVTAATTTTPAVISNINRNDDNYYFHYFNNYLPPLTHFITTSKEYVSTWHPGHCCMITGIPLLVHSYYGYTNFHNSSEQLVQQILVKQQQQGNMMMSASSQLPTAPSATAPNVLEEGIRRRIGVVVAGRALQVATTGMIGIFAVSIGLIFYGTNTSSVEQVLSTLQRSSRKHCQKWERSIRSFFPSNHNPTAAHPQQQRYDEHHPEYQKIQTMTEEEELDYIYQTYIREQSSSEHNDDDAEHEKS